MGRLHVEPQQGEQRIKGLVTAVEAETLTGQEDADTDGPPVAVVTEGEEDVRLTAVPGNHTTTQPHDSTTLHRTEQQGGAVLVCFLMRKLPGGVSSRVWYIPDEEAPRQCVCAVYLMRKLPGGV
jgi:hypothetical protein